MIILLADHCLHTSLDLTPVTNNVPTPPRSPSRVPVSSPHPHLRGVLTSIEIAPRVPKPVSTYPCHHPICITSLHTKKSRLRVVPLSDAHTVQGDGGFPQVVPRGGVMCGSYTKGYGTGAGS